jgi:hypothetical protein
MKIVSGKSLAGYEIGMNINRFLPKVSAEGGYEGRQQFGSPEKGIDIYTFNSGIIVSTLKSGEIIYVRCRDQCNGVIDERLPFPINIRELIELSERQSIMNGAIFVDKNYGLGFFLPNPFDETADSVNDIPQQTILTEVAVGDFEWWFHPSLTPAYAKD